MNDTIVKNKLEKLFDNENFKSYYIKEKDNIAKENFINFNFTRYQLIKSSDKSFIDIDKEVCQNFNYSYRDSNFDKDVTQYKYEMLCKYLFSKKLTKYSNINFIKNKFSDNYDEVNERIFYRAYLYQFGWNVLSIEKFIISKFPQLNTVDNIKYINENIDYITILYDRLLCFFKLKKLFKTLEEQNNPKKGRPTLPVAIKNYLKEKNKLKMKNIMQKKYETYNSIVNNLLSKDEYSIIISSLQKNSDLDQSISNTIIDKCNHFIHRD